ncbi:hypothetical protein HYS94_04465 [Candidatus Daviesbacteria bacterium]|nr:hypothetical protein [Candidatus Daviesbacteria bacterium]
MAQERIIYFTNDIDGVHRVGYSPITAWRLLKGDLKLPPIGEYIPSYRHKRNILSQLGREFSLLFHRLRPGIREAKAGLEEFISIAKWNERPLRTALLSGREPYKHELTRRQFTGYSGLLDEMFLNEGGSSVGWKEYKTRELVGQGYSVVHIDDDLRAGLCMARVNAELDEPRVFVYVLRNFSNLTWLVRRTKLQMPSNLLIVPSFFAAAQDFEQRLQSKKI